MRKVAFLKASCLIFLFSAITKASLSSKGPLTCVILVDNGPKLPPLEESTYSFNSIKLSAIPSGNKLNPDVSPLKTNPCTISLCILLVVLFNNKLIEPRAMFVFASNKYFSCSSSVIRLLDTALLV